MSSLAEDQHFSLTASSCCHRSNEHLRWHWRGRLIESADPPHLEVRRRTPHAGVSVCPGIVEKADER